MARYGTVYGPNGFKYTFSDEDALWAMRSVLCEAGSPYSAVFPPSRFKEALAVLWTMMNRWVARATGPRLGVEKTTFWEFIRTFSEPVNPKLEHNGHNEERKAVCRSIPRAMIPMEVRELVTRFMQGKFPANDLAKLWNFAAPDLSPVEGEWRVQVADVDTDSNVFYVGPLTKDWISGVVRIEPPKVSYASMGIGGALLVVGLLFALKARR